MSLGTTAHERPLTGGQVLGEVRTGSVCAIRVHGLLLIAAIQFYSQCWAQHSLKAPVGARPGHAATR